MPIIKTKDHIYMYIVADIADRPLVCSIQLLMILNDACIHCTVYTCRYRTVYKNNRNVYLSLSRSINSYEGICLFLLFLINKTNTEVYNVNIIF